jgi:protein-disulfide isomerase
MVRKINNMEEKTHTTEKNNLAMPIAVVIAGALIALAVFYSGGKAPAAGQPQQQVAQKQTGDLEKMTPVSSKDHIRGDINAPVKIVEYSDTECPFCKRFQETMNEVMDTYGKDGKVAWVYRHFPIDQLHSKARKEAVAMECANELGGNDKFWEYADRLYEVTPANNRLDFAELPKIAEYVGLDTTKFNTCLASTKYDKHIQDEVENAQATGGNGTPWSIVVGKDGKKYPLSGAQPISAIKQLIDLASK